MNPELLQKIDQYVNQSREAMVADLETLVAIPSVSRAGADHLPYGEGCAQVLDKALEMAEDRGLGVRNHDYYYGTVAHGAGDKTIGVFAHLDVVPEGDGWSTPPYEMARRGEYVFGRGVADNKNAAVVGLYLLGAFKELDLPLRSKLSLYLGCSEETGMPDILRYVAEQPMPDFSIVPDTAFPVCHGEKGILQLKYRAGQPFSHIQSIAGGLVSNAVCGKVTATLPYSAPWLAELRLLAHDRDDIEVTPTADTITVQAHGLASHAAHPEGSKNALGVLAQFLLQVKALPDRDREILELVCRILSDNYAQQLGAAFEDEPSGKLTCICGLVATEEGCLVLDFNVRYPVTHRGDAVRADLDRFFDAEGWQNVAMVDNPPAYLPADDPKVQMLSKIYTQITGEDGTPYTMGGGTYARKLRNAVGFGMEDLGASALDMGPGRGGAHQPDEVLAIDTLTQALKIYILSILEIDRLLHN